MSSTQPIDARSPSPEPNWPTSVGTPQPDPPDDSDSSDDEPVDNHKRKCLKRKHPSVDSESESDDNDEQPVKKPDDSSDDKQPVSPTVKKPKPDSSDDSGDESDDSADAATTTEQHPKVKVEAFFNWLNLPDSVRKEVTKKAMAYIVQMYGINSIEIIAFCLGDKKYWTTTAACLWHGAPDLVGPIINSAVRVALKAEAKKSSKRNTAEKPVWTMRTLMAHLGKNGYKGEINDGGTIPDNVLKLIRQFMQHGCSVHIVKSTHFTEHAGHRVSHTANRVCVEIPSSRPTKDGHVRVRCVGTAKDYIKFYPVSGVYWGSKDANIVFSGTKLATLHELDAFVKPL